ncbi:hypothetical protein EIN_387720 [Entamoeba invadens IP1]|uniref:TLDc domain-containing protein n=1 Tax=Entamoeba invadens IP1 TaxID=370355 RepID=A0A0A1UAE5_ENTIV|nr:hypothetical protein EIN_387720 [Entamoeba invadens IP1]ELP92008.1 hypothetical protein EIN_387720 [Entamoeba invadens IP1]|eukprot:XP_004258779.1 hypothetical protein EIN_387720 [Entamoeba invadens IP1]
MEAEFLMSSLMADRMGSGYIEEVHRIQRRIEELKQVQEEKMKEIFEETEHKEGDNLEQTLMKTRRISEVLEKIIDERNVCMEKIVEKVKKETEKQRNFVEKLVQSKKKNEEIIKEMKKQRESEFKKEMENLDTLALKKEYPEVQVITVSLHTWKGDDFLNHTNDPIWMCMDGFKLWINMSECIEIFDTNKDELTRDHIISALLLKKNIGVFVYGDGGYVFGIYLQEPVVVLDKWVTDTHYFIFTLQHKGVIKQKRYFPEKRDECFNSIKLHGKGHIFFETARFMFYTNRKVRIAQDIDEYYIGMGDADELAGKSNPNFSDAMRVVVIQFYKHLT